MNDKKTQKKIIKIKPFVSFLVIVVQVNKFIQ